MKLYIACDHAAVEMKNEICAYLREKNYDVEDLGINEGEKIDYPVAAEKVAKKVAADKSARGILICGTGIGMSIAANKVNGIRAACCSDPLCVRLTRQHNDANVLCFGARVVGEGLALDLVDAFLDAEFMGDKHQKRVEMLTASELAEAAK